MKRKPGPDDAEADERQGEGKQKRILEHLAGEVAEIDRHADSAEDRIGTPHQEHRQQDQPHVDEAIYGLAEFGGALGEGQAAPEGHEAEQVRPETEIRAAAPLDIDEPGDPIIESPNPIETTRRADFGFWLHLFGLMAFWGGLTFAESSSEFGKAMYCLVNVGLILLSVFLMRRAYAVFGAIGVAIYLGHLASRVFEDSLLFPFALSFIGLGIIGAGLALIATVRNSRRGWPIAFPHPSRGCARHMAGGAARLEHA